MFVNKKLAILAVLVVGLLGLAACQPTVPPEVEKVVTQVVEKVVTQVVEVMGTPEVREIKATVVVEVTPAPAPVTRTGPWVDRVVMVEEESQEAAVKRIQAGEIDVFAFTCDDANVFQAVKADPNLSYAQSFGTYNELTFNPAGPEFTDGRLNPFHNPKIREAMNWLVDRNYIVQEILSGLAVAKYLPITSAFPDYARYVGDVRRLEAKYAYNPDKAQEVITQEMEAMGAELVDGKWQYKGNPVTLIFLMRVEDERKTIGDYVANQLENIGFTVDRQYKTRTEASPIWVQSNPADGQWHIYTGGWITTEVDRDQGSNFSFFYTPRDYPIPLHQAYTPAPEFDEVALKLRNNDFKTMEERAELFVKAMDLAMQDSVRVWLVDQVSFAPYKKEIAVTYDLAGSVSGAALWPYTIRRQDQEGGTIKIAQPGLLVDPWNPVAGSNWIYDMMPIRATADWGVISDPYTGLAWPQRVEKAELYIKEGLPVARTLDWVDLQFVPEIEVPADAWVDWDAANQKFITAGEKYTQTVTANVKAVVYYPADLFQTVKWHDGSNLSVADFVMFMIMAFDPAKPESAIFDEAQVPNLEAFMAHFKGVKIVSTDPLIIETYDDAFRLDAERNIYTPGINWFPFYTYGPGAWHSVGVGVLAEAAKELAFSADKADALQIEWMSYVSGPSLEILKKYLDQAAASNFTPYTATLSAYLTPEEVQTRWTNYKRWYAEQGHFWIGTGPFYLDKVFPVEGTLTLLRNEAYPDLATKWAGFAEPKLAVAEIDGPGTVQIGSEATFDVYVTFKGAPYPQAEIGQAKYLLFDAKGELVASGEATAVEDGKYQIVLGADVTGKLEAGSNKLEIAISPTVVSIPSFAAFEFVTTAP